MDPAVFHMYKNPIECVRVMHYARLKPHFEENIEDDHNRYGCSP